MSASACTRSTIRGCGVLGEGQRALFPPAKGYGEHCKLDSGVWGSGPVAKRFPAL